MVMELVEGETLEEHIERKAVSLAESCYRSFAPCAKRSMLVIATTSSIAI